MKKSKIYWVLSFMVLGAFCGAGLTMIALTITNLKMFDFWTFIVVVLVGVLMVLVGFGLNGWLYKKYTRCIQMERQFHELQRLLKLMEGKKEDP